MNIERIRLDGKIEITFEKGCEGQTIYTIEGFGRKISTDRKCDLEKIVIVLLNKQEGE